MSEANQEKREPKATPSKKKKRWSTRRKMDVVLRLLRGESLEAVSRDIGVPVHRIAEWRDQGLAGLEANLKARSGSTEVVTLEKEKRDLQAKLGEVTMDNELLRRQIESMESGRPFGRRRRSKR